MSFNTCPIATVDAPAERVWAMLSDPASYAQWWDAETRSIAPEGPASPGQRIEAQAVGLARRWDVHIRVEAVDAVAHQLALTTRLPLGITVRSHISVVALGAAACRVTFG